MWISRKRFNQLEKEVADLEAQVQSQQNINPLSSIGRAIHESITLSVDQAPLMHQK